MRQPIAVVHPHEANLRAALGDKANGQDLDHLCKLREAQDLVVASCNKAGKSQGFKPMETLTAVVLTHDEWTPENGLVTAAQKLQRRKIEERYASEIKVRLRSLCLPFLTRLFEQAAFKSSQGGD